MEFNRQRDAVTQCMLWWTWPPHPKASHTYSWMFWSNADCCILFDFSDRSAYLLLFVQSQLFLVQGSDTCQQTVRCRITQRANEQVSCGRYALIDYVTVVGSVWWEEAVTRHAPARTAFVTSTPDSRKCCLVLLSCRNSSCLTTVGACSCERITGLLSDSWQASFTQFELW